LATGFWETPGVGGSAGGEEKSKFRTKLGALPPHPFLLVRFSLIKVWNYEVVLNFVLLDLVSGSSHPINHDGSQEVPV
jgi:hypothetical protein